MKVYDSIIIGGGPAGLSAAIYLARYNRTVLILDKGNEGRWNTHELNQNYLGFPEGIHTTKLRELGRLQTIHFGAEYKIDEVTSISKNEVFEIKGLETTYQGKTIILATGVKDIYPVFEHLKDYIGKSLFWCITCDGWKTKGKKVLVVGNNDEGVCTCLQLLNFTDQLEFITNCDEKECKISDKWIERLKNHNITFHTSQIKEVIGHNGFIEKVILENGDIIETDILFNQQGAAPNNQIAKLLNIELDDKGYIKTDHEQRTNIPFVYAAGDVTKLFAHQIVTAAHEGSTAAQAANYDLYNPEQKED